MSADAGESRAIPLCVKDLTRERREGTTHTVFLVVEFRLSFFPPFSSPPRFHSDGRGRIHPCTLGTTGSSGCTGYSSVGLHRTGCGCPLGMNGKVGTETGLKVTGSVALGGPSHLDMSRFACLACPTRFPAVHHVGVPPSTSLAGLPKYRSGYRANVTSTAETTKILKVLSRGGNSIALWSGFRANVTSVIQ